MYITAMGNIRIKDLAIDTTAEGFYIVRKKDLREFSRGQFVSLELGDNSGRINGVIWEPDTFALTDLTEGMVIKVRGQVGEYNGKKQLRIERIRLAKEQEYKIEELLPHSAQTLEHRKARINDLTEKIQNSYIKSLALSFTQDETFMNLYLTAPAGKLWHHATIGGLSEHSANVAELTLRVASGYDFLNTDYLIFGGIFHDAGKIRSYTTDMVIDYTDEGRLLDHIVMADAWICQRAAAIPTFPDSLLTKLRHMILSHHGERAHGSPVVPQMPEAFVLYYCDEIDSKMGAIERIRDRFDGKGWSDYVKVLDRFLYFGDSDL